MDISSVKELFALESKVHEPEKQRAKSKAWCLVYWIEDKQVSIESLSCVEVDFRQEGEVSNIRFRDGKKYPGKILRINGTYITKYYSLLFINNTTFAGAATTTSTSVLVVLTWSHTGLLCDLAETVRL